MSPKDKYRRFLKALAENKRAAPGSFALILILPSVVILVYVIASVYFSQSYFTLWLCAFREITGLYCPACGATRAVGSLIKFKFLESFLYNPFPVMIALFLFAVWINAIINVFYKQKDSGFPHFYVYFYSALGYGLLYWILRNVFHIYT